MSSGTAVYSVGSSPVVHSATLAISGPAKYKKCKCLPVLAFSVVFSSLTISIPTVD